MHLQIINDNYLINYVFKKEIDLKNVILLLVISKLNSDKYYVEMLFR